MGVLRSFSDGHSWNFQQLIEATEVRSEESHQAAVLDTLLQHRSQRTVESPEELAAVVERLAHLAYPEGVTNEVHRFHSR